MAPSVHEAHKGHAPRSVTCAVVTVSDTRSEADDESGSLIVASLESAGHRVASREVVPDDIPAIRTALDRALEASDALILNGGTGVGRRDVTVEAVAPYLEKELEGFGEAFRRLSYDAIGSPAILSRATAGIHAGKLIVALPGSPKAAALAMDRLILPELAHIVSEASR